MDEVTEDGVKAKGKRAKKAEGEGNPGVDGQIGRMLVRAIWAQEWSAANPEAKAEARKAAWKEGRAAALEKNLKTYRRALGSLSRSGVTMTVSAEVTDKSDEDDDNEA